MLFISSGMEVETFEAAEDLLKFQLREKNSCVISDIKMRGLSGLELKQKLAERGIIKPNKAVRSVI
jgi:FixJ family two-component response regulator